MTIRVHKEGAVTIVTIDRLEARNAVNPEMADALFREFPGNNGETTEVRVAE